MSAIDAALAFAVKSYAKPATSCAVQPIAVIRETKPRKMATPKTPKPDAAAPKAEPINFKLPEKGSLEAKGFMVMMRRAQSRDEKIMAIAAFVGYDVRGDYGSQELNATMMARRELSPIGTAGPSLAEQRAAQRSALGFVSGMPNALRVKVQDLLGREKMAADLMISHQKDASVALDAGRTEEHAHHLGLALLEKERLAAIQAELRTLVG